MDFAELKKRRQKQTEALAKHANQEQTGGRKGDDRFWTPTVDKAGNGFAVIRFLPTPGDSPAPWVKYYDHGFTGPTARWYIENSLTSIGQEDPVSELNSQLWASGEEGKEQARKQKRRLHYVSNILVIKDSGAPENNGKVFLFKYGKKIYEKIADALNPKFEDETPLNPFDLWEGADFKLKIVNKDGYRNYDSSSFAEGAALFEGDEKKLKSVFEQCHDISEFLAPSNFKTYEELKKKLDFVLGKGNDAEPSLPSEAPKSVAREETTVEDSSDTGEIEDDDAEDFFAKLERDEE